MTLWTNNIYFNFNALVRVVSNGIHLDSGQLLPLKTTTQKQTHVAETFPQTSSHQTYSCANLAQSMVGVSYWRLHLTTKGV